MPVFDNRNDYEHYYCTQCNKCDRYIEDIYHCMEKKNKELLNKNKMREEIEDIINKIINRWIIKFGIKEDEAIVILFAVVKKRKENADKKP